MDFFYLEIDQLVLATLGLLDPDHVDLLDPDVKGELERLASDAVPAIRERAQAVAAC